jgi:hypothetical protein
MRRSLATVIPAFVLTIAAGAQTTRIVTQPNGVQAAIQASAPGDIILLPNTGGAPDYLPFTVDKGITIRGDGCRIGHALPGIATASDALVVNVPGGQRAHLDGLDLSVSYSAILGNTGLGLVVGGGSVTLQRCTIRRRVGDAIQVAAGTLLCQSCTIESACLTNLGGLTAAAALAGGNGIVGNGANVCLRDCTVRGSDLSVFWTFGAGGQQFSFWPAGSGVVINDGTLHAERTFFFGGRGTVGPASPQVHSGAPGLYALGAARVWLADGSATGGNSTNGATGAAGFLNMSSIAADVQGMAFQGGSPSGWGSFGPVNAAPLARLTVDPAWQRGVTSTLTVRGSALALFGFALALDPTPTLQPFAIEPLWLLNNVWITGGLLDGAGAASVGVAVPNVPSLQHQVVWCQALSGTGLPLRATTPGGGLIL